MGVPFKVTSKWEEVDWDLVPSNWIVPLTERGRECLD